MATKRKRPRRTTQIEVEEGSGNVFEDLGFRDASDRLAKAELARVIRKIVQLRGWTQRRAAEETGR